MLERGVRSTRQASRLAGLSRSSVYYPLHREPIRRPRPDEPRVRARVRRAAFDHPTFGYRRIWAVVRAERFPRISLRRVRRLVRLEGLGRPRHFPRPRVPESGNLSASRPNERWYTDLTYIDTTDQGPVPLMSVLDGCTREIVSWELYRSCGASEALAVVERAVEGRFPKTLRATGTLLVTDGGPQFTAERFREGVRRLGLEPRATRKRRPEDNGMIESFQGHFKHDYLWIREPGTYVETRVWVRSGMADYNESRPHSSLNYLAPVEFAKKIAEGSKP
ncbi:MAG: IS3 family transposase [Thermoplasmata archaeon]